MTATFSGFPSGLLHFLSELEANNNGDWFHANKERYEEQVREPALAFIEAMARPLEKISPFMRAEPKKVGGSLMRIHRDIRFSKDKQPYKTNVGIHFRHQAAGDVHTPAYYFHIEPDEVFLGVGIWRPDSPALAKIRKRIDERPDIWKRVRDNKAFRQRFTLQGDSLKRPPRGYDADHPYIEDLKRKDFIGIYSIDFSTLFAGDIVKETTAAFRTGKTFMKFLCGTQGLDF